MLYRNLGRSNLRVSTLCLGAMMFGDQTGQAEAGRIVAHAHDNGVNFIDTADVYTKGASEEMVGTLIKDRRHDWVLATKLGSPMSQRPNEARYSRSWMMREVDASLRRLQTDHIDIYYMHRDFDGMDLEEAIRALGDMVRSGKIRYWGVSNFRGWRIAEMVHVAARLGVPQPVVCQPYYNLLNRMPEVEILPACRNYGIGVASYSPIARGVLTGKYAPGAAPDPATRAGRADKRMVETEFRQESLVIARKLAQHAQARGVTPAQFATAWVLANGILSSVIAGPRTLAQWQDYFPAVEFRLDAHDEALVESLVPQGHPSTPGYTDPAYPLNGRIVSAHA
jgi:aryl-alcohol dehydrogenase-like predicted oxidoreductase